ncbi:unnamed protein product [Moneuplotes crassus]|uniref:BZIP domain-containing protein n=2 Tax=Euplotes crassus TaxID=5936 RepID=A0AAD1XDT5_EUPCR|nr:unnamed protein product [Moneuplotes crassus]
MSSRRPTIPGTPSSPTEVKRKKNREKVKRYRDKMKKYYEDLESENERLSKRVVVLNDQVSRMQADNEKLTQEIQQMKQKERYDHISELKTNQSAFERIPAKADKLETSGNLEKVFQREEHFWSVTLPKMISENPDNVRQTLIQQNREIIGVYGTARIAFLKQQFTKIIENILPIQLKVFLHQFDSFKLEEWMKLKEAKKKDLNANLSGIQIPSNYQDNNCTTSLVEYLKKHGKLLTTKLLEIRGNVQALVRIRNELLKTMKEISEFSSSTYTHEKPDLKIIAKKWAQFQAEGLTTFKLYKLGWKPHAHAYSDRADLTGSDHD